MLSLCRVHFVHCTFQHFVYPVRTAEGKAVQQTVYIYTFIFFAKNRYTWSIFSQKQVRTTTKVKSARQEPCDWPASHRTFFRLETGQAHLGFCPLCLAFNYFSCLLSQSEVTHGSPYARHHLSCVLVVSAPTSPHHHTATRHIDRHTLVYIAMDTDGSSESLSG